MPRPTITPKARKVNLGVTVSPKAKKHLFTVAKKRGVSASSIVEPLIMEVGA